MPSTTVNTPIGKITVNHPEGASDDAILEFAKAEHDRKVARRAEIQEGFEQYSAADTGAVDNFLAGAGKFFVDTKRGISQLFGADNQAEIDESRKLDQDLLSTKAGIAGNITGGVAGTLPLAAIPGVNTTLGASALGAGIGATQPVATGESRIVNAGLSAAGGAVGSKIGQALSRGRGGVVDDIGSNLNSAERGALAAGRDAGLRATPGVTTGSKPLQRLEAAFESKPFTAGPIDAIKDANQTQVNRLFAEAIGETADVVDSTVIDDAFTNLGRVFDDTAAAVSDQPIEAMSAGRFLAGLQDEFRDLTNRPVLSEPLIKRFISLAEDGQATGRQLRDLTSKLGRKANTQFTSASGDRELGNALGQMKNYVDDIIEGGLSGEQLATYRAAREQYRTLLIGLSRNNIINPSSGNVNANALASALRAKDRSGFLRGQNQSPLYNAARFGQAFQPIVGNSGTATRSVGASDAVLGLPANLASRLFFSQPATRIAQAGNRGVLTAGHVLGPAGDPRLLGLLGASAAGAN